MKVAEDPYTNEWPYEFCHDELDDGANALRFLTDLRRRHYRLFKKYKMSVDPTGQQNGASKSRKKVARRMDTVGDALGPAMRHVHQAHQGKGQKLVWGPS